MLNSDEHLVRKTALRRTEITQAEQTFELPVIWTELGNKTGSRNSDGGVPSVNYNPDNRKVYVNYYNPDNANDNLRSRSEVSA